MSKTGKIIFVLSLMANVFLISMMVGQGLHHKDSKQRRGGQTYAMLEKLADTLPEKKAAMIRTRLQQEQKKRDAYRQEIRGYHQDALAILIAPTFDKDAYIAAVMTVREVIRTKKAGKAKIIAEIAAELSQEERQVLAKEIERKYQRWQGKK